MHEDLIARCRLGDRDAHYRIYKLYSRSMYNVSFRITGREEDAEDALQEAFVSAFKNLDRYRGDATFGPGFYWFAAYCLFSLASQQYTARLARAAQNGEGS